MPRPRFAACLAGPVLRAVLSILLIPTVAVGQDAQSDAADLQSRFDEGRGQLQVGGPYAGLEFHHSRPLPSRVSFFYPVANSIDLSTDYWERDESMPFSALLTVDDDTVSLGDVSFPYRATPASVVLEKDTLSHNVSVDFRFGESLPLFVLRITITNRGSEATDVGLVATMNPTLRTSHAYEFKTPTRQAYRNGEEYHAHYDDVATDSAAVFIVNVGARPGTAGAGLGKENDDRHDALFSYHARLEPDEHLEIVQLIGSCRQLELAKLVDQARAAWRADVEQYEERVANYALRSHSFKIDDAALLHTARWSKAILASNMHYLRGQTVPMPTPAQYNFFFTHDLLVTDLGAVMFDTARVARDLRYLGSLAYPDSLLPHAYYWRNDEYVTESAGSDNWNHLWFILLASSYLKHSGDSQTLRPLWPMIRQSVRLMLKNEENGLMYSERPDWWDIGHVYGERTYLTTLMVRALKSYVYMSLELGLEGDTLTEYLDLADHMEKQLVEQLWDDDTGYLLNRLDSGVVDRHYYSGSLLAAAFDLLDDSKADRLLETARSVLLDDNIGIRNAMPPDFLEQIERYRFNGPEVGAPYQYMNGGVWPQGIAWYAMGLLAADRQDEAADIIRRHMTLEGIARSPNGQPALFEYRNADASAPEYGSIDKTTFLWAGGWYLYVLYQLAGVRENEWNLWFAPNLPTGFDNLSYDLMIKGRKVRVVWAGEGRHFERIVIDGRRVNSAVATGPVTDVMLTRGSPDQPYLAHASGIIDGVIYDSAEGRLDIEVRGLPGQLLQARVVSPMPPAAFYLNGDRISAGLEVAREGGVHVIAVSVVIEMTETTLTLQF